MTAALYTLGYTRTGRKTHLLYGANAIVAVCGIHTNPFDGRSFWRGTGSQAEYDRAAALKPCGRCSRLVKGGYL